MISANTSTLMNGLNAVRITQPNSGNPSPLVLGTLLGAGRITAANQAQLQPASSESNSSLRFPAVPNGADRFVHLANLDPVVVLDGGCRSPFGTVRGYYKNVTNPLKLSAQVEKQALQQTGISEALEKGKLNPADMFITSAVSVDSEMGPLPGSIIAKEAGVPSEVPCEDVNLLCGGGSQAALNSFRRLATGEKEVAVFTGFEFASFAVHSSLPKPLLPENENWPNCHFKVNLKENTITLDTGSRARTIPLERVVEEGNEYFVAKEPGRGGDTVYKIGLEALGTQSYSLNNDGYMDPDDQSLVFERASKATDTSVENGRMSRAALTQEALVDFVSAWRSGDLRRQTITPITIDDGKGGQETHYDDETIKRINKIKTLDEATTKLPSLAMRPLLAGGTLSAMDSSQQSDGAATGVAARLSQVEKLGLQDKVVSRVLAWGETASAPGDMATEGFIRSVEDCLQKTGIESSDIKYVEAHKPFGITLVRLKEHFGWSDNIVNQIGGSTVNKGHPPAATGVRLVLDAQTALKQLAEKEGLKGQIALTVIGADGGNANHRWALFQLPTDE